MEEEKWLKKDFDVQSSYKDLQEIINHYAATINVAFLDALINLVIQKGI